MEYQQFTDEFIENLNEKLASENVELTRRNCRKVNEELEGLSIKYPDSIVAPTIYLDDKYQSYQDGLSIEEIVERTVEQLNNIKGDEPVLPELNEKTAKENLYCVVVNAKANSELLQNVPHEMLEDIAVIPRFRVGEDASFIVTNDLCNYFYMTPEEVLEVAHKNTNRQEFKCQNMDEVLREVMQSQGMSDDFVEEMLEAQEASSMYVLTNEAKVEGAVAITSSDAMQTAYDKLKAEHPSMIDMYVLGSSRHELILLPDDFVEDIDELQRIHEEIQASTVDKSDQLTDKIYKYDAETKQISIADTLSLADELSHLKSISESVGRSH